MIALWLALLAGRPGVAPPALPPPGRIVTTPTLHVGVRGAVLVTPDERAAGFTIQISVL